MWERYLRRDGEFSVPSSQVEVDAVLAGVQTGRVPVFDDSEYDSPCEQGESKADSATSSATSSAISSHSLVREWQWQHGGLGLAAVAAAPQSAGQFCGVSCPPRQFVRPRQPCWQ